MSKIRSKNTKPEILVRKFLHTHGFRFRLHGRTASPSPLGSLSAAQAGAAEGPLPGKPDIVLPKYKTVIFIHGCFWHGHKNCRYYVVPKTRTEWWLNKINTNRVNDEKAVKTLRKGGWKVITIWECGLKHLKQEKTLNRILQKLLL